MLTVQIYRTPESLSPLASSWDTLLAHSDLDCPFMTFGWFKMYWRLFERRSRMLVVSVSKDGEVIAIAPLMLVTAFWRGVRHTALTFIANFYSNVAGVISRTDENMLEPVLDRLARERAGFDMLYANFILEGSKTDAWLAQLAGKRGLRYRKLPADNSPYIPLPPTWEEFLGARNKHFRDNYKKTVRIFEQSGEYAVHRYRRPEELPEAWEKVIRVSRNTWKYKTGTAIASNQSRNRFYRSCAEWAAAHGWFELLVLQHKDRPIAFCYDLPYKKKVFSNKSGFDENYARLSPGTYIITRAIRDAIEGGYTEFDLMGKNEEYKMRFTSLVRRHHKFIIFNSNGMGKFLSGYELSVIPSARTALKRMFKREAAKMPAVAAEENLTGVRTARKQLVSTDVKSDSRFKPYFNQLKEMLRYFSEPTMR